MSTSLLATALAYAAQGLPVFPCRANSKTPACPNGFHDASINIEQINAWWAEDPNYNLAICPEHAGWCVVDEDGDTCPDLPDTFTVRTPRGGQHRYFEGSLPSTVRKLFPNMAIDTRGRGGYVLVPPSIVDGQQYEATNNVDIASAPTWIAAKLLAVDKAIPAAVSELDQRGNIERALSHLRNMVSVGSVAISGRGGNLATYQLACEIINLGITPDTTLELIREEWNPHCIPPWSDSELQTIVANASAYAQNEPGAWGVPPATEVFGHLEPPAPTPEKRSRFYFEDEQEQEQGKEPKWLIQDLIPERATVLMIGPSQHFKSFIALDIGLSISCGVDIFGTKPKTGATFYGALEGRWSLKKARRRAWKIGHQVDKVPDFYVGTAPIIGMPGECQEFGKQVAKRCPRPRLIVLDTLSKCMAGLNENDAGDASKFVRFCDSLVEAFGCSVIAIHHTGKDESRGARGSSAFYAGFDTVLEVKAHRATKAVEVWVRKHKDAEEREMPWTFEGRAVGDSLVFFPTSKEEHQSNTETENIFLGAKIGATLRSLGATGSSECVTTLVLATSLIPPVQTETPEERERVLSRASHRLRYLAKSTLKGYCEGAGRTLTWFLPNA